MTEFEELYERYARDVYRFALYLSGSRAEAEDIAAETFARAWTARHKIRVATVKAHLFTIARHLHADGRRQESRRVELSDAIADPGPGAALETESRQELGAVLTALQKLPKIDRAALLMRAQDGISYEEIAASLGLSVPAAKVKVHRARLRLVDGPDDPRRGMGVRFLVVADRAPVVVPSSRQQARHQAVSGR